MADIYHVQQRHRELQNLLQMKSSTDKLVVYLKTISKKMEDLNHGMSEMSKVLKNWENVFGTMGEPVPECFVKMEIKE
ncbi:hypothetical protein AAMO2058_000118300 [Amorphochlora amoebiformis]